MSQLDRVERHFSGGAEAPEVVEYRPISPLVIAACITGLASLLAVVHPLLWIFPVVAVILSVCAIRQVSGSQSRYGGRLAAVAALCLAVLAGSYAPARALSLERALYTRAQTQANKWISLIQQGRYQEAHQFTLSPSERFQGSGPLTDHYRPPGEAVRRNANSRDTTEAMMEPSAGDRLAAFLKQPVIAKLVAYGKQGPVEFVQNVSVGNTYGGNVVVTQRFRASGVHEGQPGSIEFLVKSTRWEALGHANWQVGDLKEVE